MTGTQSSSHATTRDRRPQSDARRPCPFDFLLGLELWLECADELGEGVADAKAAAEAVDESDVSWVCADGAADEGRGGENKSMGPPSTGLSCGSSCREERFDDGSRE